MVKQFEELQGVLRNPYIGFTSFQHFDGEALYSDCISGRTEICGCETESYECYPVPEGVEEKGREQGFHPDNTVAYIRSLWKEFEPRQGEYNYEFIENILRQAKEKGQTVMFRLMPHSTCARDDVPDWLKEIMDCPERPEGMRVKDSPKDPRYLKLFGMAIEKLGERFDKDETLDCIDVSLGGAWGEGGQAFPKEDLQTLMDIYVRVFPNTKLLGQICDTSMVDYIGSKRKIGWRADGIASPKHMNDIYPPCVEKFGDRWKTAPVSLEAYWWISEWRRQGWDIDKIIETTLSWHVSTFNNKFFPIPYEWKDNVEKWLLRMGYRFYLKEVSYPEKITAGETAEIAILVENKGVAPIYNQLPLKVSLKNAEYVFESEADVDICSWLPGEKREKIQLELPKDMPKGSYELYCSIGGGSNPVVKLATDTQNDGTNYWLGTIEIY